MANGDGPETRMVANSKTAKNLGIGTIVLAVLVVVWRLNLFAPVAVVDVASDNRIRSLKNAESIVALKVDAAWMKGELGATLKAMSADLDEIKEKIDKQ